MQTVLYEQLRNAYENIDTATLKKLVTGLLSADGLTEDDKLKGVTSRSKQQLDQDQMLYTIARSLLQNYQQQIFWGSPSTAPVAQVPTAPDGTPIGTPRDATPAPTLPAGVQITPDGTPIPTSAPTGMGTLAIVEAALARARSLQSAGVQITPDGNPIPTAPHGTPIGTPREATPAPMLPAGVQITPNGNPIPTAAAPATNPQQQITRDAAGFQWDKAPDPGGVKVNEDGTLTMGIDTFKKYSAVISQSQKQNNQRVIQVPTIAEILGRGGN